MVDIPVLASSLRNLLVVCLLTLSTAHIAMSAAGSAVPATTAVNYQPGVHVGDWWQLGFAGCGQYCSWFRSISGIASVNSTVIDVQGTNVTLENIVHYLNRTTVTINQTQNVETGHPGIPYYLLSANLTTSDHVYNNLTSPVISTVQTVELLGAERNVTTDGSGVEWDQLTGILVSVQPIIFTNGYVAGGSITLIATNIWKPVPDFTFSMFPSNLIMPSDGTLYLAEITITSLYGFSGDLTFSAVSNSTKFVVTLGSSIVNVSGLVAYDNLTASSHTVGDYSVNVTATSGSLSYSATIQASVRPPTIGSFTLTASHDSVALLPGNSTTVNLSVTSVDNFTGPVFLNVVGGLNDPFGPELALNSTAVSLGMNQTSTVLLTVQTPFLRFQSHYLIEIDAYGGLPAVDRYANITLTILNPDFTLATSPDRVSVSAGQTANSTITVGDYGVYGNVTLATTVSPSGADCTLSKTRLPIIPGLISGGRSTLSCHGSPGTYTVMITATIGSLTHSRTVTVTVESAPVKPSTSPGFSLFGLPLIQSYGVIAGIIGVVVALAGIAVYSRQKKRRNA